MTKDEAEFYFDADGLMSLKPGERCDNGLLFAAEYYYLLKEKGLFDEKVDALRAQSAVDSCRIEPGLYNRNRGRGNDTESFDDYVGITALSVLLGNSWGLDICTYGDSHGYTFDNVHPKKFSLWAWRQGADIAFYQLCAGRTPTLWDFSWLSLSIMFCAFRVLPQYSSDWITEYLRCKALDATIEAIGINPAYLKPYLLARTVWKYQLLKKTNGRGVERLMEIYFPEGHPNREFSKGIVY